MNFMEQNIKVLMAYASGHKFYYNYSDIENKLIENKFLKETLGGIKITEQGLLHLFKMRGKK